MKKRPIIIARPLGDSVLGKKGKEQTAPIWALGTMSGTSLDGVDAALIRTDGEEIQAFGQTAYRAYTADERAGLRAALGRWPGDPGVARAAHIVESAHIDVLRPFAQAAVVGFHGQTLAHDPKGRGTHQAGDGAILARALGRTVVWDFRSSDVALGGEGAPLAPIFHAACARYIGARAPVAFLNLGGVGNLTWVDPRSGGLWAFDTGPGNAPMDDLVLAAGRGSHDAGGAFAAQGQADARLVARALSHVFYTRMPPKSLDRASLVASLSAIGALPLPNALASLVEVIVGAVDIGLSQCPSRPAQVLVTGGGRRNTTLMARLRARLGPGIDVQAIEQVGLDGDMLEAQAFGYLAVRVMRGLPTSFPTTTGVAAAVGGGQIARPAH